MCVCVLISLLGLSVARDLIVLISNHGLSFNLLCFKVNSNLVI